MVGAGAGEEARAVAARAGVRVSGEEERRGHDQGPGPAERAEATPKDGGCQEHHHPRRPGSRLAYLIKPSPPSAVCSAGPKALSP